MLLSNLSRKASSDPCIRATLQHAEDVLSRIRSNIYTSGFYDIFNSKEGRIRINQMLQEGTYGEYIVRLYNQMFTDTPPPIADIEKAVSGLLK